MSCRDISMAEPSGLSTVWLGQLQKQLQSRSRGEAVIGISLHPRKHPNNRHQGIHSNPHLGNVTDWLHAFIMLPLMCRPLLGKSLCRSLLEHDYICKLQASFLFTESRVPSLGLKMHWSKSVESCNCDQRSWPSFHPWSHSNCRVSAIASLSLGRRNVFNRIPGSELTMQRFHAALH